MILKNKGTNNNNKYFIYTAKNGSVFKKTAGIKLR